jgi:predicted DNA-binding helix-hairpin-helix protein
MRYYGFCAQELTTVEEPNLDLVQDPKLTWALRHRDFYPVDVNLGTREALLRVPGIGYRNVQRILNIRRYHRLTLSDLRKLNVRVAQASNFITALDHVPAGAKLDAPDLAATIARPPQLELFTSETSAMTGEI